MRSAAPHQGGSIESAFVSLNWICPACAPGAGLPSIYPPGPDAYCEKCCRPLDAQERIAAALAELVRRRPAEPVAVESEIVDVDEAARILKTTTNGIYALKARGKMPPPVGPGRNLRWRRADLLGSPSKRASSRDRT